ncbi:MAG: ComEC/Rec2 family competence protein [Flavobacteriales bacterium]
MAAKLGTVPVSLYCFYYFPMLFLLSSMVLTPLIFLLLSCGGC